MKPANRINFDFAYLLANISRLRGVLLRLARYPYNSSVFTHHFVWEIVILASLKIPLRTAWRPFLSLLISAIYINSFFVSRQSGRFWVSVAWVFQVVPQLVVVVVVAYGFGTEN